MVWAGTGVISFLGALCYSELALLLPESGSDYTYIKRGMINLKEVELHQKRYDYIERDMTTLKEV